MNSVAIIPARMSASRFPGKPIAKILGKTMIEHVYERCKQSPLLKEVFIATCDKEIEQAAHSFGAKVIWTSDKHTRASDRVAEAAQKIAAELSFDVAVMVQGDEPMISPKMIQESLIPFSDSKTICSNLMHKIETEKEFRDPNCIKVVFDKHGDAIYMSREPIPTTRIIGFKNGFKQVCVIPFRKEALELFTKLPPTPLEISESIDMLRFIEHGYKVRLIETHGKTHAVDTPADLAHVESLMQRSL